MITIERDAPRSERFVVRVRPAERRAAEEAAARAGVRLPDLLRHAVREMARAILEQQDE